MAGDDERRRDGPVGVAATVSRPAVALNARRRQRARWVPPLMACVVVVLFAALWSGLVHLGLALPAGGTSLNEGHGPMMILGVLGTVIALERAVALGVAWSYLGPTAAAAGGLAVLVGAPDRLGPVLLTGAGVGLVAVYVMVHRIQASLHNLVLAAGAVCWVMAGALWVLAGPCRGLCRGSRVSLC